MALVLAVALQAPPVATAPVPRADPALALPGDLAALPPLPWRLRPRVTPDLAAFVGREVRTGRCTLLPSPLDLDFAVLVRSGGIVRRVVPRAIGCPTVEQYGAGLVTSMARANLVSPAAGWYRARLSFAWR